MNDLIGKLHDFRYQLVKRLRREPTTEELAEVLGIPVEDVEDMLEKDRKLEVTKILKSGKNKK